ncbi:MAG: RNA polymerase sigma factor [bacterium]|nr:RNA polymerase sigma factor [bacterium]
MTDAALQFRSTWHAVENALGILAMSGRADEASVASTQADAEFVAEALNGDGDAYGKVIELHQGTIAAQMRRFSRDHAVVEELVHDVFVEAYVSLKSYRANSPLLHWLRKIAVRVGYRYWKRQSRQVEKAIPISEIKDELSQLSDELTEGPRNASETLGGLLDLLPPADRLVLTLIYWDGCSVAEAAEFAGWSKAKVKVQAFRARNRLQSLIEESLK